MISQSPKTNIFLISHYITFIIYINFFTTMCTTRLKWGIARMKSRSSAEDELASWQCEIGAEEILAYSSEHI